MKLFRDLIETLSRWQTTVILLGLICAALGAATFIESALGTSAAEAIIYQSWWMYMFYFLLILNFILVSRPFRFIRRKMWGAAMLHYGFIIILIGAFITHVWSFEGVMSIREGETTNEILKENSGPMTSGHPPLYETVTLPFSLELHRFTLVRYAGSNTPSSYESDVTIRYQGKVKRQRIFMNNIARVAGYRIYQSSYNEDEKGTILTVNYDPVGTLVTYVGYFILIVGLVLAPMHKKSRFRYLLARLNPK